MMILWCRKKDRCCSFVALAAFVLFFQIRNVSDTGLCASVVLGREGGEDKKNFDKVLCGSLLDFRIYGRCEK